MPIYILPDLKHYHLRSLEMTDYNLLIRLRSIDLNHNGIIDGAQEIKKAQSLGIDVKEGDKIEKLVEKSSKMNLQDMLKQIDQTQTVDNKQEQFDPLKRRKLNLLG